MTSKLKCPFCAYELQKNGLKNLCCPICGLVAPTKLWQALIQSQQDLEESQQATLENAQTVLEIHKDLEIARKAMNQVMSMGAKNNICYHLKAKTVKSILGNALEQIEHKE